MTSDAGYHLLRVGNEILTGSLHAFAVGAGGLHGPLLGAVVTAFGALPAGGGSEVALLIPGSVLLGASAAALAWHWARTADRSVAVLAVALLLIPPSVAASFTLRPDAALAGLLLLLAFTRATSDGTDAGVLVPAWLAPLAAPWTLPAALALSAARVRRPRTLVYPALAVALVAGCSLALPDGSKLEVLRGLFGEVSFTTETGGLVDGLRRVWGGGVLFFVPLLLPLAVPSTRPPVAVYAGWAASALLLLLGSEPGAFRAGSAALLPAAAFFAGGIAWRFPDPRSAAAPRRPVLLALLVPALLLLFDGGHARDEGRALRRLATREQQIGVFLRDGWKEPGNILGSRVGALGAVSGRPAEPIGNRIPDRLPGIIVLGDGLFPAGEAESALYEDPRFLARYAAVEFRRGPRIDTLDAIWVHMDDFAMVPKPYADALLFAEIARRENHPDEERRNLLEAHAFEPAHLGRAREALGLHHERLGNAAQAERYFDSARERDPFMVRSRGHLIDRALARGSILRADTLVTEAVQFNPHLAEVRGTRARLFSAAGLGWEAVQEAEAAVRLEPGNGRLLVNLGIFLWQRGSFEEAKEAWHLAIRQDRDLLAYLGNFDNAPTDLPAPPSLPLFTDVEFAPFGWRNEVMERQAQDATRKEGDADPDDADPDDAGGR